MGVNDIVSRQIQGQESKSHNSFLALNAIAANGIILDYIQGPWSQDKLSLTLWYLNIQSTQEYSLGL